MGRATSLLTVDDSLVLRSQEGDEAATSELVALVRPAVQRYARRFFPDPARAEDLAQTALMKAFARVRDLRSPEAFRTWLLRITRNECLNELARHRVTNISISTLEAQGDDLETPAGGPDDPEEMLVRSQMQALVRRAAASLPERYRRTLTMRALEDRSYEEISEELDIPVAVARLWYCRARKRFRIAFVEMLMARRTVSRDCQEMGLLIADMIEGTLPRADRDRTQEHLTGCAVCRQTEDELRNTAFRSPARVIVLGLGLLRATRAVHRHAASAAGRVTTGSGRLLHAGTTTMGVATATVAAAAVTTMGGGLPATAPALALASSPTAVTADTAAVVAAPPAQTTSAVAPGEAGDAGATLLGSTTPLGALDGGQLAVQYDFGPPLVVDVPLAPIYETRLLLQHLRHLHPQLPVSVPQAPAARPNPPPAPPAPSPSPAAHS